MMDWRAYIIAFIACAGWQHEQGQRTRGGQWVDVAEQARQHGAWHWTTVEGK